MQKYLSSLDQNIFTSRNDSSDLRFGDVVEVNFSGELAEKILSKKKSSEEKISVVILGVPQDIGVERNGGRVGAALAPDAIRRAFYKLTVFDGAEEIHEKVKIYDLGNIATEKLSLEEIHERQKKIVAELLEKNFLPVVLGGGHDCAYPNGSAMEVLKRNFSVLNFDAHTDVRPLIEGKFAHSGSPFRQLLEENNLLLENFVEFGIQKFAAAKSHVDYVWEQEQHVVMLDTIREIGFSQSLENAYREMICDATDFYVSFDMDAVASAFAPGVSAPAATGFTAEEFCEAARFFGSKKETKLFDLVEVDPRYDVDGRTAKLAALGLANFLSGIAQRELQ